MTAQPTAEPTRSKRELELRQKHRDDFTYYSPRALRIRTKDGTIEPLVLNKAQLYLHARIEDQRRRTGKVRILIVKGRQQGCSTYTEGRFFWKATHRKGAKVFILTHLDDATKNLFGMAKRYYEHVPKPLKPSTKASNAKELVFDRLDSSYFVGTAGSKGVGRSDTIQFFHGSEVAYWPHADTHVQGALQAVPNARGTEVILESTAAGPKGLFANMCKAAIRGEGEYELVFIPWYWQDEYRADVPDTFTTTSEELKLQKEYRLTKKQLQWRRNKIAELDGVHNFRREYPFTAEEAFSAEVPGALWTRELIQGTRWEGPLPPFRRIVVAVDPSGGDGPTNDEVGIVAGGLTFDGHVLILNDDSGKYSPQQWGLKAVARYKRLKADRIIGEDNFGGKMVEHTITVVDAKVSYKSVHASRGKVLRAEPVVARYQKGLVHHVGEFIAMEDEMVTFTGERSEGSPNRLDAVVWVVTELLLEGKSTKPVKPVGVAA